jgi:anaerobic ribonucleoside-triphosphate reductase
LPFCYGDLQAEMDLINRAFIEVMTTGDIKGRLFTFPIPTYNITSDFNWDHPNTEPLFEMTAKYGLPYFQNFINSELQPGMVRSMCCRLQLDLRELLKRGNGSSARQNKPALSALLPSIARASATNSETIKHGSLRSSTSVRPCQTKSRNEALRDR